MSDNWCTLSPLLGTWTQKEGYINCLARGVNDVIGSLCNPGIMMIGETSFAFEYLGPLVGSSVMRRSLVIVEPREQNSCNEEGNMLLSRRSGNPTNF